MEEEDSLMQTSPTDATHGYACDRCGSTGVKLWRPFGVFDGTAELICFAHMDEWVREAYGKCDPPNVTSGQSWYVPAVPVGFEEDGDSRGEVFLAWADEIGRWRALPLGADSTDADMMESGEGVTATTPTDADCNAPAIANSIEAAVIAKEYSRGCIVA